VGIPNSSKASSRDSPHDQVEVCDMKENSKVQMTRTIMMMTTMMIKKEML
jgi:hypothetical protein